MDASTLTARRKARVLYFDYALRNCAINDGDRVPRPIAGGSSGLAAGFDDFGAELERGSHIVTQVELDLICPPETPQVRLGSAYTFFTHTTYPDPDQPNYYYRVYNTQTNAWSALIDSGYSVNTYSEDFSSKEDSKWFVIGYTNGSTKHVHIINPNASTITRTLTYSTVNNNGNRDDENGFFYYSHNGSSYDIGALLFSTNTLIETTIGLDDTYEVDDIEILESSVLVHMHKEGSSKLYLFKGTTTTMVQESSNANVYSNDVITYGCLKNEEEYITTIFCVDVNGNYKTYEILSPEYTRQNMGSFGINKDRFYIQFYKEEEGPGAVYAFDSTGTLIPVVNVPEEGYNLIYYDDDDDLTGQSNIFAISIYSEGYSDYGTGRIYVLFDGQSDFQTISFTEPQQKYSYPEINGGALFVPYRDDTSYYMKTITPTGTVNTFLHNYEPDDSNLVNDLDVLNNYAHFELHTGTDNKNWYIIKNDGTISATRPVVLTESEQGEDERAGNVLMHRDDSTVGVFIDGQYTEIAHYNRIKNPHDVLDSNTVYGYGLPVDENNVVNDENNVVVASLEHGIKYQTVPDLDSVDQIYHLSKFVIFMKTNPFKLYVVTTNGQLYTYSTVDNVDGGYKLYNTDTRVLIRYTVNDLRKYIAFNSDTNEFTQLSETKGFGDFYDVYSNFPYVNDEDDEDDDD